MMWYQGMPLVPAWVQISALEASDEEKVTLQYTILDVDILLKKSNLFK